MSGAFTAEIIDELEIAFTKLQQSDVGCRTNVEGPAIVDCLEHPRRIVAHARDHLVERNAEQQEFRHDVWQVDDPTRATRWRPIARNRLRKKALLDRTFGLLPGDVTNGAMANVEPDTAAAGGQNFGQKAAIVIPARRTNGLCLTIQHRSAGW